MFVAVWQLWLLLLGVANAIFYEDGFDHHYTYSSESDILGLHNVTTIIKVIFQLFYTNWRTCTVCFVMGIIVAF